MTKNHLRIEALGTAVTIAAEEEAVYLNGLLGRYLAAVEKTKRTSPTIRDPLKLAILTGFQFCDELQKLEDKTNHGSGDSREAQMLTESILAQINEVLPLEE
jgi:cell division protein ZapA (FtsZ GTPase activity inhibitor)